MWPFYDIIDVFFHKTHIRKSFKEKCKDAIEDIEFEEITEQAQVNLIEEINTDNVGYNK